MDAGFDSRLPTRDDQLLRRDGAVMLGLVAAYGLLQTAYGELIPSNGGLGYDGTFYGELTLRLVSGVRGSLDSYHAQRLLPSALVALLLKVTNAAPTIPNVILGFRALTLAELLACVGLWLSLSRRLGLESPARWLGFTLLFLNFGLAKHSFYYPVLTDLTAFTLGFAMWHAFMAGCRPLLFCLSVVGSFAWPIASFAGASLLLVPARQLPLTDLEARLGKLARLGLALAFIAIGVFARVVLDKRTVGGGPIVPVMDALLPASALVQGVGIFCSLQVLATLTLQDLSNLRRYWSSLALAALCIALPSLVTKLIASDAPPTSSPRAFLGMLTLLPLTRPGITVVSHFAYFGIAVPLAMLRWRSLSEEVRRLGLGAVAFFGLSLIVALTPESRQSMLSYPALVTLACIAYRNISARSVALLAVVAGIVSRVWWPLNTGAYAGEPIRYFVNHGPYMSSAAYLVFLTALALSMVLTSAIAFRRDGPGPPAVQDRLP